MAGSISGKFSDWRLAKGNWNFTDDGGGTGTFTIFNVTGDVLCKAIASVNAELTSTSNTGTVALGVAGNTGALCVQDTADSTAFQIGNGWSLATASNANGTLASDSEVLISNSVDIIMTVATNALLTGDMDFYCLWRPMSEDGNIVPA